MTPSLRADFHCCVAWRGARRIVRRLRIEIRVALCGVPILPTELEYALEYRGVDAERASPSQQLIRFHLPCHAIWDYERTHP